MDYVDVFFVSVTEKENTLGTYIHGTNFPSPPPFQPCLTMFLSPRYYSILPGKDGSLIGTMEKGK